VNGYNVKLEDGLPLVSTMPVYRGRFKTREEARIEVARLSLSEAVEQGIADNKMIDSHGRWYGLTYREYYEEKIRLLKLAKVGQ